MKRKRLMVQGYKWIFFFQNIYPAKGIRELEFSGKIPQDFYVMGLTLHPRFDTELRDLKKIYTGGYIKHKLPNKPVFSLFIGDNKFLELPLVYIPCNNKYGTDNTAIPILIKAGTKIKGIIKYPCRKVPLPSKKDNKLTLCLIGRIN